MMNKLMVLVAIALVGSIAFVAQSHADDCMPWAGKESRPASDWNQCKEVGFIASEVADMRDHKLPQSEAAPELPDRLRRFCFSWADRICDAL